MYSASYNQEQDQADLEAEEENSKNRAKGGVAGKKARRPAAPKNPKKVNKKDDPQVVPEASEISSMTAMETGQLACDCIYYFPFYSHTSFYSSRLYFLFYRKCSCCR